MISKVKDNNMKIVKVNKVAPTYTLKCPKIRFPSFDIPSLHLDDMEIKKKLRKKLPLIPKRRPLSHKVVRVDEKRRETRIKKEDRTKRRDEKNNKEKRRDKKRRAEKKKVNENKVEEDMIRELGVKEKSSNPSTDSSSSKKDISFEQELGKAPKKVSFEKEESIESEENDSVEHEESVDLEEENNSDENDSAEDDEDDEYAGMSPEEREDAERQEYIWRYRILRRKYKKRKDIPEYNEHSDLETMKRQYNLLVKELYLDDSVSTYRSYLIGGFMLVEWGSTQMVGIDMTGFTKYQMKSMTQYERLLIELGEKSYDKFGSSWSVEMRLIGFIILQAAVFYLGKIISARMGTNVSMLFRGMSGGNFENDDDDSESQTKSNRGKRKMRGPSTQIPKTSSEGVSGPDDVD